VQAYHKQASATWRAIGDQRGAGYVLTSLGITLEALGEPEGAEVAYREALAIRRETGQVALAIEDVAGLGRVALARGRPEEAKGYAEECLAHIEARGVDGIEQIFEVYLACVRILEACGDVYTEQAREILEQAYTLLMERADKIGDEALRRSFLENVPTHRELMREAQRVLKTPG